VACTEDDTENDFVLGLVGLVCEITSAHLLTVKTACVHVEVTTSRGHGI